MKNMSKPIYIIYGYTHEYISRYDIYTFFALYLFIYNAIDVKVYKLCTYDNHCILSVTYTCYTRSKHCKYVRLDI